MIFAYGPNRHVQQVAGADTGFHKLAIPAEVPLGTPNVVVAVCTLATSGTAGGSPILMNFDQASAPSIGFPVLGTDVFQVNTNLYYAFTVASDVAYFLYSW